MAAPPPPFDASGAVVVVADAHETRQLGLHVAAWFCTGVAACTVAMKLFTKARIVKMVGWDDFIILLSLTLSVIAASLVSSAVVQGLGRHTAVVLAEPAGAQRLVNTTRKLQVGYALHIGAFSFPNIAIALLVVQLLDRNVGRAWALYGLVGVQAAAAVASMGVVLAQCGGGGGGGAAREDGAVAPLSLAAGASASGCWDPAVFNDFSYFVAAYTALTDVVLAGVPVAAFWRLQMPARTKLGVCLLMGLTLLSAVVTIVKASYLHLFTDFFDPLWNVVPLVVWSLIEQNVVIVAACIPTLRPIFTKGVLLPFHHHHHHHQHTPSGSQPPPQTEESPSWLGSWKAFYTMKTQSGCHHRRLFTERPNGGRHRRLFTTWDEGGGGRRGRTSPWCPRATSDTLPLHQVGRPAGPRRSHPADPAFPDDAASQKGIVRTVAVALEWDLRRPPSTHSAKTDWLLPPPPPPAAAGAKGGLYER